MSSRFSKSYVKEIPDDEVVFPLLSELSVVSRSLASQVYEMLPGKDGIVELSVLSSCRYPQHRRCSFPYRCSGPDRSQSSLNASEHFL